MHRLDSGELAADLDANLLEIIEVQYVTIYRNLVSTLVSVLAVLLAQHLG